MIIGVSGSGKTWLANQLKSKIPVYSHDANNFQEMLDSSNQVCLFETPVMWSTYKKKLDSIENAEIITIAIGADFLATKQNLKNRGGKITPTLYRRQKRLLSFCKNTAISAQEAVIKINLENLKTNKKHLIYKATSPSGKVYVGKTISELTIRIKKHNYNAIAQNRQWLFSKAIRKYGIENIKFEIIETVYGNALTNIRETFWIRQNQSNDRNFGYNLTGGGEGRSWLNEESEINRVANITLALNKPETKLKLSVSTTANWNKEEYRNNVTEKTKATRGTIESRQKTSDASRKWYDEGDGRAIMSAAVKKRYSNPTVGKLQSKKSREKQRREILCFDLDGNYIDTFYNNMEAAENLNIPQCGISSVLSGRFGQTRGYIFKLKSDIKDDKQGESL